MFALVSSGLVLLALKGGYSLLMLWPALSVGLVSLSYFCHSTVLFGKRRNGSRRILSTIFFAPYLAFAWCVWNLQVFLSREQACHAIGDHLIVARRLRAYELPEQVDVICDLTYELLDPKYLRRHTGYICCPMLDANGMPADALVSLVQSFHFASEKKLLIHCANGHGRTGLVAAAWLISTDQAECADDALKILRAARPGIKLRARQRKVLDLAESLLKGESESKP